MLKLVFVLSAVFFTNFLFAQSGGNNVYEFLNLHPSARVAALGGTNISIQDNDINFALNNPALLNPAMHNHFTFNTVNYFTDINSGYAAYARKIRKAGTFSTGIQYINYGNFKRADPSGQLIGDFTAGEYNYHISMGRQWKRFSYGAAVKMIWSTMESYSSYGVAADLGGLYSDTSRLFTAALTVKNIGAQIKTYVPGNKEPIPFEIQIGLSKKLKNAPLRFSLTGHNLQIKDLSFENPNKEQTETSLEEDGSLDNKITLTDKIMRHTIIGTELLLTKSFHFRFGYNHQRRKEMTLEGKRGLVGFAWGFGIRISKFHLSYGSSSFHTGNATNHFSVVVNFSELFRRKKTTN